MLSHTVPLMQLQKHAQLLFCQHVPRYVSCSCLVALGVLERNPEGQDRVEDGQEQNFGKIPNSTCSLTDNSQQDVQKML